MSVRAHDPSGVRCLLLTHRHLQRLAHTPFKPKHTIAARSMELGNSNSVVELLVADDDNMVTLSYMQLLKLNRIYYFLFILIKPINQLNLSRKLIQKRSYIHILH